MKHIRDVLALLVVGLILVALGLVQADELAIVGGVISLLAAVIIAGAR